METEQINLLEIIKAIHSQAERALDGEIGTNEALASIIDMCCGPLVEAGYTLEDEEVLGYEASDALGG